MTLQKDKLRVLLVDDEQDITTVMKMGLQMHGFEVDVFNNPVQALSAFKAGSYGVILLDIRMPGMNGFELARKLWQSDPDARICFMTAFEIYQNEASKVFPNIKNSCFIKKPIASPDLVRHIQSHFITTR